MFEEKEAKFLAAARASAAPTPFDVVLSAVMAERVRQLEQWGRQDDITRDRWFTIMMEELGEAARASLHEVTEHDKPTPAMSSREELTQLVAICFRAMEVWGG